MRVCANCGYEAKSKNEEATFERFNNQDYCTHCSVVFIIAESLADRHHDSAPRANEDTNNNNEVAEEKETCRSLALLNEGVGILILSVGIIVGIVVSFQFILKGIILVVSSLLLGLLFITLGKILKQLVEKNNNS